MQPNLQSHWPWQTALNTDTFCHQHKGSQVVEVGLEIFTVLKERCVARYCNFSLCTFSDMIDFIWNYLKEKCLAHWYQGPFRIFDLILLTSTATFLSSLWHFSVWDLCCPSSRASGKANCLLYHCNREHATRQFSRELTFCHLAMSCYITDCKTPSGSFRYRLALLQMKHNMT